MVWGSVLQTQFLVTLKIKTVWFDQTVLTHIRLLLQEHSDHCLQSWPKMDTIEFYSKN